MIMISLTILTTVSTVILANSVSVSKVSLLEKAFIVDEVYIT